jgi:hypothetical protein
METIVLNDSPEINLRLAITFIEGAVIFPPDHPLIGPGLAGTCEWFEAHPR